MKKGYKGPIASQTTSNAHFRHVVYTGEHMQLVLMTLQPGEEIGAEAHEGHDQFFRFEAGVGCVDIADTTYEVSAGDAVIVPSGAMHNVRNTSASEPLQLYTLYTPPEHRHDVVHLTKLEAEADDEHFDGVTNE
jgi:mannose-6-phosphate isomerase-like protein (cupin superfamily)